MKRKNILLAVTLLILVPRASAQGIGKNYKVVDKNFLIVTSSLAVFTVFDVETTFAATGNPKVYVREGNPVMRPFINAGRPATYAFLGGVNAGIVYISYRMRKSANPIVRKLWWVGPIAATASHAIAGGFNLRFTFR